jgi:hypothetical protein
MLKCAPHASIGWTLLPRRIKTHPPANTRSRTSRSAVLPELPQFLAYFTARTSPVVSDAVPQFSDMTTEIQLVLFEPTDVEFLARGTAFELTCYIFFVVADNSVVDRLEQETPVKESRQEGDILSNDTSGAHTLCTLRNKELALLLDGFVNIITFVRAIRLIIMSNIVDMVLGKKLRRDDPWAIWDNLIHPLAMSDGLRTLSTGQDGQTFTLMGLRVTCHTDKEIGLWERSLCLLELPHVSMCN